MSNLQTEVKNWVLEPRKEGWANIHVTEDQAKYILNAWKRTPNAELYDRLTGRLLEVLNRTDYHLRRIDVAQRDASGDVWVCDCGARNPLIVWPAEKCACGGKGVLRNLQKRDAAEKAAKEAIEVYA